MNVASAAMITRRCSQALVVAPRMGPAIAEVRAKTETSCPASAAVTSRSAAMAGSSPARTYPSMPVVKVATASQISVRYGTEGGAGPGAWEASGPWAPAGVGSEAFSRLTAVLDLLHPVLVTLPRAGQRCDPTARRPAPQAATRPRPAGPRPPASRRPGRTGAAGDWSGRAHRLPGPNSGAGSGPAGWAGPDPSASEADDVGHLARLRGLVGGQDHAEHADALDLVVDRALTGHQAVHEVCDLGPEGVHALVLEDLLLLTAHVHAQGGAVGAERTFLADHGEAVGAGGGHVGPGGDHLAHRAVVETHQHLRGVLSLHELQAMGREHREGADRDGAGQMQHQVGGVVAGVDQLAAARGRRIGAPAHRVRVVVVVA